MLKFFSKTLITPFEGCVLVLAQTIFCFYGPLIWFLSLWAGLSLSILLNSWATLRELEKKNREARELAEQLQLEARLAAKWPETTDSQA